MSVLLLGADYYGTLAAARCFGKHGIPVTMASDNPRARALYSRHVKARLVHPPMAEPQRLIDWLVDYGKKHPGTLLYPPNDHLAWLFAAHRDRLREAFVTYAPGEDSLLSLLDKKRLHEACAYVGIDVPMTRTLDESAYDARFARRLRWPVLIKPRTQIFLESGIKGFIVHDPKDLPSELRRFRRLVRFNDVLTSRHPDLAAPMIQDYIAAAETSIFSVSGFITRSGELVSRAAMKVLQRPRKVGIGLCFEGRPTERWLADKLTALCKRVGYYGCFEAEFIADGAHRLLIDFNPRFYSQMGFDIARGLPLPMLVWHSARGEDERVASELARARAWRSTGDEAYCHKTMLDVLLTLQGLSRQMSRGDVKRWREWYVNHRDAVTDAVRDPDDQMPMVIDTAQWVQHFAKHPRSFVRSFVFNR
jgi:predicted ATP-grasp superfamily ATP-dependent carboligase